MIKQTHKLTEENKNDIIECYNNWETIPNICKSFNIDRSTIYYILKQRSINNRGENDKGRIHSLNWQIMKQDSIDKYYWLGFLAADGNVSKLENCVSIELKTEDRLHLEKIRDFLGSNAPIVDRINNSGCHCSRIVFCSTLFSQFLKEYNIIPNKSLLFTIPLDKIPQEFLFDFIRGLYDGDGSIYLHNKLIVFSFCSGNKECVFQVKEILQIKNKLDSSGGAWRIATAGKKALAVFDKIYQNSSVNNRLDRKFLKYQQTLI